MALLTRRTVCGLSMTLAVAGCNFSPPSDSEARAVPSPSDTPAAHAAQLAPAGPARPVARPVVEPVAKGAANGPRIEFAELTHDLGKISDSKSVSHTYSFKNTGTETLVIEKVGKT